MRRTELRGSGRAAVVPLAAMALMAAPLTVVILLQFGTDDRLPEIETDPIPVILEAREHPATDEQPGQAIPVWGEAPSIHAPAWSGTVTEIAVDIGAEVRSGEVAVVINDIARVAWHSATPFYRTLDRGAEGDDVAELQRLLASAGYYDGEADGSFGPVTAASVKQWAQAIGVRKPTGSFEPGWVVWLPEPNFKAVSIELTPGAPAPSAGAPILRGSLPLRSVELTTTDGHPFELGLGWVLVIEDTDIPLGTDGTLGASALDSLGALIDPGTDQVAIRIRRAEAIEVIEVPARAVMTNASGAACLWVQEGSGYAARTVEVGTGRTRTVDVTGITPGTEVLVNPGELLEDPACP